MSGCGKEYALTVGMGSSVRVTCPHEGELCHECKERAQRAAKARAAISIMAGDDDGVYVWRSPKVDLLQVTQGIVIPTEFNWESDTNNDADALPEFAGRLCYLSFGEGELEGHRMVAGRSTNERYLDNIMVVRHGSVIEHSVFTFLFQGVSRTLTHELVRHRHLSYSQLSQRYVEESNVGFVLPPEIDWKGTGYDEWWSACSRSLVSYGNLLRSTTAKLEAREMTKTARLKAARGTARSVLCACAETKIVVTGNARAWRHFLDLRATAAADAEIRRLSIDVWDVLSGEAPNLFGDYVKHPNGDGTIVLETPHPWV